MNKQIERKSGQDRIAEKVIYKRELNHSYMVLPCQDKDMAERYDYRIMQHNRIGRLLPCSLRYLDGEELLYYDITSRQPLARLYESRRMKAADLERIIRDTAAVQAQLGEYMLDESGVLLEEEVIFADVETGELYFAFYPGGLQTGKQYVELADFFLEHIDHGQEQAVNLAYEFYKLSKADYFVLSSFLPFLEKEMAALKQTGRGKEHGWCMSGVYTESGGRNGGEGDSGDWSCRSTVGARITLPDGEWPVELRKSESTSESGAVGQRGALTGVSYQDAEYASDIMTEGDEQKAAHKPWWKRLFSGFRKSKSLGEECEEVSVSRMDQMVWDSYEQQLYENGSQETVYFADLDSMTEQYDGLYCLNAQGKEQRLVLKGLPLTIGKLKGRVSVVLSDRSVSRIHARLEGYGGRISVRDLNSRNGTSVNGHKLSPNESVQLQEGDMVCFGRERFRYERVQEQR